MKPDKILIIEDDPAILFGLKDNFEMAGYSVKSAVDGQLGLDLAMSERPDLIVLDIMRSAMRMASYPAIFNQRFSTFSHSDMQSSTSAKICWAANRLRPAIQASPFTSHT